MIRRYRGSQGESILNSNCGVGLTAVTLVLIAVLLVAVGIYFFIQEGHGSLVSTSQPCPSTPLVAINQSERIVALASFGVEGLCLFGGSSNSTELGGLVYIAASASEQTQGFQNVTSFGNCNANATSSTSCVGMIFVMSREESLCFWMHNTRIPLQQVWISSSSLVVATFEAQPYSNKAVCHTAQFVLETFPSTVISLGSKGEAYKV
jgi:uncharacterized membrane protein (UPF0127 family)